MNPGKNFLENTSLPGCHGLSARLAEKYWWADVYRLRRPVRNRNLAVPEDRAKPGYIQIRRNPTGKKTDVIVLFAQYDFGFGGHKRVADGNEDTQEEREQWFKECLETLGENKKYQNLAFPYKIGCSLAGGNWDHYLAMFEDFTVKYKKTCDSGYTRNHCFLNSDYLL